MSILLDMLEIASKHKISYIDDVFFLTFLKGKTIEELKDIKVTKLAQEKQNFELYRANLGKNHSTSMMYLTNAYKLTRECILIYAWVFKIEKHG